jgi:cytoskeletal protein CcmA (bactofilin family)
MFEFGKKGEGPGEASNPETTRRETPTTPSAASRPSGASASGGRREAAIIGPSIQLDGDLRGQEDLLIEGEVNGTVQLRNNSLTIGSQGKIKADVYAKEIHVDGLVEGDLFGAERVVIRKSAQVRGNITSPRVSLEEGAHFKGSIEMDSAAVESALGKNRGASVAAAPIKPAAQPAAQAAGAVGVQVRSGAAS